MAEEESRPCEDKLDDVDDSVDAKESDADFDVEETNAKDGEGSPEESA